MKTWAAHVFENTKQTVPRYSGRANASELIQLIGTPGTIDRKEDAKLISFAELKHREKGRGLANTTAVGAVTGDWDHGFDRAVLNAGLRVLEERGVFAIAHETFNSRPDSPRWRVFAFLDEPIQPEAYRHAWEGLNAIFCGAFDHGAKDASRISYLPGCPEGETREVVVINEALWLQP